VSQILRPYQVGALNRLKENIRSGIKTQVLQMSVGSGKTSVASAIMQGAQAKGNRAMFIVDSLELVDQAAERFMADGLDVGVIQGQHYLTDYSKPIQVATIQTLKNRWPEMPPSLHPKIMMIDECFAPGTKISTPSGARGIEFVRCGDYVYNATGVGIVEAISTKLVEETKLLVFDDGTETECTSNHPFFTDAGWVPAGAMEVGTIIFSNESVRVLRDGLFSEEGCSYRGREGFQCANDMRGMPACERYIVEANSDDVQQELRAVRGCIQAEDYYDEDRKGSYPTAIGVGQAKMLLNILLEEAEKPHALSGNERSGIEKAEGYWPQTQGSRGERHRNDRPAEGDVTRS